MWQAGNWGVFVRKSILEKPFHQPFCFAEGSDVIAKVARRQQAHLLTEAPATAPIVGDRNDRSDMIRVSAQASQELRHASPTTDGHNIRTRPGSGRRGIR
jgi:hypothetical protein